MVLDDPFQFRDYYDDAYLRDRLGLFAACDAMLWGRTTYERFAKLYAGREGITPYAARLNAIRKYVFSSKLETAAWHNSTIVRGDVVAEVTKLKQQNGGDLLILVPLSQKVAFDQFENRDIGEIHRPTDEVRDGSPQIRRQ
jgi:hypothetical protein